METGVQTLHLVVWRDDGDGKKRSLEMEVSNWDVLWGKDKLDILREQRERAGGCVYLWNGAMCG